MPRVEKLVSDGRLTRSIVQRFVAGDRLEDALEAIAGLNERGIGGIFDLLGEGVSDPEGAQAAADDYLAAIKQIEETGLDTTVTIKLTQLGLGFDRAACVHHVRRLATEATGAGTIVEIDMEQSGFVTDTLGVYEGLHPEFPDLRVAIQAYLRRTPGDLARLTDLRPKVRLVKGAYAEPPEIAFQKRKEIDSQYAFLADWLLANGTDLALGSHDHRLLEKAQNSAAKRGIDPSGYEIQMLYGVRRELQEELADKGFRVRVYVPYGSAWYPYLMRRLAERPANLRFMLRALVRG